MLASLRSTRSAPFTVAPPRRQLVVRASQTAAPASLAIKAVDGSDKGAQALSLKVADEDTAKGLVTRYLIFAQQNARRGTASTLTKGEVRGGGRKPYAQKGTGNARRGSTRSPLFPGGGVTFGPKPRDWTIKMNKQERRLALATAFQSAAEDIVVVESLETAVADKKTKSLIKVLADVGADPMTWKTLLIVAKPIEQVEMAGRNIERLCVNYASAISIFDLLNAQKIVIEAGALEHVQAFYGPKLATA